MLIRVCIVILCLVPLSVHAEDVAAWVPWFASSAAEHARDTIDRYSIVHPFVYTVAPDTSLVDKAGLASDEWGALVQTAHRRGVPVIPTITWTDGAAIDATLRTSALRAKHIAYITRAVADGNFDGIEIDYEQKRAETRESFSTFLRELKAALGDKQLYCTVEARTPYVRVVRTPTSTPEYANDYRAIGTVCDVVSVMAYDQQRIDWTLNTARRGEPYMPVADSEWVRAVLGEVLKVIPAEKVMLGIPTYGRVWTVTVAPQWYQTYTSVRSVNASEAEELAQHYTKTPGRNAAGERSFTYFPDDSIYKILEQLPVPPGTRQGFEAAAKALFFANATGMTVPVNLVWYSDADAVMAKRSLAQELGLRGIALFKVDGGEQW